MLLRTIIPALLLVLAAEAPAQTITDVDAYRAGLAKETDANALRRREAALKTPARTDREAMLERGLVLMRLYEMNGVDKDISQARSDLERGADRNPGDARLNYAYGLSNAIGHGVRVWSPFGVLNGMVVGQSVAEIIKRDPVSKAKNSFKKALAADPLLKGAALGLAALSLDGRDKDNLQVAAKALRHIKDQNQGGAEIATALSEVEAALGNLDAASSAATAAVDMEAASSSALRAQAAALLRQAERMDEGARSYFEGVEHLDAEAANQYFEDVLPIANDRERAQWTSADINSRKEWLKRFWDVRAASGGVTVAERMGEHYTRLALAH